MEAEIWQALGLTFQLAIITTLLLLLGGLPLAHFLNSLPNRFGAVLETIVGLPIVLPPTVLGFRYSAVPKRVARYSPLSDRSCGIGGQPNPSLLARPVTARLTRDCGRSNVSVRSHDRRIWGSNDDRWFDSWNYESRVGRPIQRSPETELRRG